MYHGGGSRLAALPRHHRGRTLRNGSSHGSPRRYTHARAIGGRVLSKTCYRGLCGRCGRLCALVNTTRQMGLLGRSVVGISLWVALYRKGALLRIGRP